MTSTPSRLAEMESASPTHVQQPRAAAGTVDYCIILGARYIIEQLMVDPGYVDRNSFTEITDRRLD